MNKQKENLAASGAPVFSIYCYFLVLPFLVAPLSVLPLSAFPISPPLVSYSRHCSRAGCDSTITTATTTTTTTMNTISNINKTRVGRARSQPVQYTSAERGACLEKISQLKQAIIEGAVAMWLCGLMCFSSTDPTPKNSRFFC